MIELIVGKRLIFEVNFRKEKSQ